MAGLRDATGEDDGLGIEQRGVVGQTKAQNLARTAIDLDSEAVALLAVLRDEFRRQLVGLAHE